MQNKTFVLLILEVLGICAMCIIERFETVCCETGRNIRLGIFKRGCMGLGTRSFEIVLYETERYMTGRIGNNIIGCRK